MKITSLQNGKIKAWAKLRDKKYRDKEGLFLVEGEHLIEEARAAHCLRSMIALSTHPYPHEVETEVYEVSEEILRKLSTLTSMEPWIGVCSMPQYKDIEGNRLIVLDGIQDPGNLGTILRTAVSFGFHGVVLSDDCVDAYNEKVIRSTQGAIFHIPMLRTDLQTYLPMLKERRIPIYATALQSAKDLRKVRIAEQYAVVFGNEGSGIKHETLALCDHTIKIEMDAFESLNVAVAAGICMYYFRNHEM